MRLAAAEQAAGESTTHDHPAGGRHGGGDLHVADHRVHTQRSMLVAAGMGDNQQNRVQDGDGSNLGQ